MTKPTTIGQPAYSLTRDLIHALRYYLGNWRAMFILATIVIVAGLALNWSWLVAVGVAPLLLSTLPCLVMCAVGVCAMCRSGDKQSAPVRDLAEVATSPATLAVTATDNPSAGIDQSTPLRDAAAVAARGVAAMDDPAVSIASCCQGQTSETNPPVTPDVQSNEERKASHA